MTGVEEIQRARAAGFSDGEISDGIEQEKQKAVKAGFSPQDVDAYYGAPAFDPKPIHELIQANLMKPAKTFEEGWDAGWQSSVSGLGVRGKSPDTVITDETPRISRVAGMVSQMAGDLPAMLGGAALGFEGGPIGMMAGGWGLAGGMRKIMMDKYERGEATTFSEFWDRASGATVETLKGLVTGAAVGGVGKVIQGTGAIVSPALKRVATGAGEIATMVAVGNALEGKMPNANDFIDTAIALGFLKTSVHVAGKLRDVYARTGVKPEDVARDAMTDPKILQDLASFNRGIPKAYVDRELDFIAQNRRDKSDMKIERRETGAYVDVIPKKDLTQLAGEAINAPVKTGSEAGVFRGVPYDKEALHQEGPIVTRPMTHDEEMKQYAAVAYADVFPEPRGKHEVTDTSEAPLWYRQILDTYPEVAPWELDRSLMRLKENGVPENKLDQNVLEHLINDQGMIRTVDKLSKEVPDTQLKRSKYDKGRAFRTAEEILQERNYVKNAEEMISHEPRPKLRDQMYILPKGRGPVIDSKDMADITNELHEKGIVFGESGKPQWEENITPDEAQAKILGQIVQHEPGSEKLSYQALYTSIFDNLNPIKEVVKGLGVKPTTEKDPYMLQRLTRGVMGKAKEFLDFGAFDFDTYKTKTRGYTQIIEPVKKDLDGFRAYMAAERVIEKEKQGITTGFDLEAAKAVVKAGYNKYRDISIERQQYRDAMLEYLKGAGILNQARFDAIKKANKDYVPFYRFFEEEQGTARNESAQVRDPIKEMTGSNQKIVDPIVSDIKDTFLFIALADKNAARQAFVSMGEEYAKPVRGKSDRLTKQETKEIVEKYGVTDEAVQAIANLRPDAYRAGKNELAVFHDGERTVYRVDPKIAEAFEDMDRVTSSMVAKIFLHMPAGLLRAGVTITPDFIGRNLMRDAISSFVFAGSHPLKTIRGAVSLVKQDEAFHQWLKGGGANATMVAIDRNYIQSHIMKLNSETGLMERALNVMKTPLDVLRALSEFAENATRLGAVREELATPQTKATIQAMAMIAREATVDFGRHGRDLQNASKSIAFFNPALQGIDRFARAMHDNPVGTTAKALASVTLPSMLLWYANKDDQEIQDLPRWQKDLFWLARIPAVGPMPSWIMRIPKAHEIGILFGTLPERMLDAFMKDNPDAFKDFHKTILGVLIPSLVPTAAIPVVEQFANRSSFTNGPLVPAATEKMLPEYQYNEYTSETAKALGKIFGAFPGMERTAVGEEGFVGGVARALTTPAYIENYVRQWTGGMGMYALQLADFGLRDAGLAPDPAKAAWTVADVPVVKAFVARYPSSTAQSIQDFYSNFYVAKRYYDTTMELSKNGDPRALKLMAEHSDSMVQLDGMRETLTGLSKLVHDVNKNPEMTPSDKRQLIDTMYYQMISIAKAGNDIYRQIGAKP